MLTRIIEHKVLTIALSAVAVLVWTGVGYNELAYGHGTAHPTDSMLLTSNRSELAICVEALTSDVSTQESHGFVEDALAQVRDHPDFKPAGLDVGEPIVDAGCPAPANLGPPNWNPKLGAAPLRPVCKVL